jgi:hypothetical protein
MRKFILAAVAVVAVVGGAVEAGARRGPQFDVKRAPANGSVTYTVDFVGGEPARINLRGDGDTDLDLYVYDENGNLVGSDVGPTDRATVAWSPRWTGPFTIRVVNLGNVYNEYRITTN